MSKRFKHYLTTQEEAGYNLSWGSIIAGIVTFFSLLITLSLIGSAIGFGMVQPTSDQPLNGVGTGVIIWTTLSLILSFLGAGFVSGIASRRIGLVHGFLTWASTSILLILVLSYASIGILSSVGSLFGNIASATGSGIETVASGLSDTVSNTFDKVTENMDSIDTRELQDNVEQVLQDTDVPELQPDYLKNELTEVTDEVTDAGKEIATNPENSDKIIDDLLNKLDNRANKIGDGVDEDAIANAVSSNTELNQQEAEEATKNIVNGLKTASEEAQNQIKAARSTLEDAKDELNKAVQEARETTEEASNAASKASIFGFIAMLLGLIVTSIGGLLGSNFVKFSANEDKL
jgi:polyhydroxyalkanoate synthesis regulator phasin